MFSVLIPTYNYDVSKLVNALNNQFQILEVDYEIIVFQDGSTTLVKDFKDYKHVKAIISKENLGRVKSRQFLATQAKFDWLLFLDADVLPKAKDFIAAYIEKTNLNYEAIFGGFAYYETPPEPNNRLRWKYGKAKEQVLAIKRNKTPYKVIISANFIIKKTIFIALVSKMSGKGYGYDNYFGALLKQNNSKVFHIDNEVYHLGIENSKDYLKKKEQAAKTLLNFYHSNAISTHDNSLLHAYSTLKKYNFTIVLSSFFKLFKNAMRLNLTATNPSIFILQLYKISFMCYSHHQKN